MSITVNIPPADLSVTVPSDGIQAGETSDNVTVLDQDSDTVTDQDGDTVLAEEVTETNIYFVNVSAPDLSVTVPQEV